MQVFGFGKRRPAVGNGSRRAVNGYGNVSISSPLDQESPLTGSFPPTPAQMRSSYDGSLAGGRTAPTSASLNGAHPQSAFLNTSDPVAMHLLMETAMVDSKTYEILSFEEVEETKRERAPLQNRIEATRRKLALERKLKDAAQSLNRLYSTKGNRDSEETTSDGSPKSPRRTRKSILGNRQSSSDVISRTDDEFAASHRKCDELEQELSRMEKRYEELERRLLQHTAGILQLTHRGLKKNLRRDNLPRSPESLTGVNNRNMGNLDRLDDFDDRSLYKSPDLFGDGGGHSPADIQMLHRAQKRLDAVNQHVHEIVLQADPDQQLGPPPQVTNGRTGPQNGLQIQAQLEYLQQAIQSMEAAQAQILKDAQSATHDSEDQVEDINVRLHRILQKANSDDQAPVGPAPDSAREPLQAQLSFSATALDRLNQRVEHLVEQKNILSTQIRQQRNLNSKSDAERDAQITDLTEELSTAQDREAQLEDEAHSSADQIHQLMEQLDSARQEAVLVDQKRGSDTKKTLQIERRARTEAENSLKQLQATLEAEKDSRRETDDSFKELQGELLAEKDARKQADKEAKKRGEDSIKKHQALVKSEKASKKKVEEGLERLKGKLEAETKTRNEAEESLAVFQATLQAGNDAQKQITENIGQLQASVQAEKEGKQLAEEQISELQELLQKERDSQRHADGTLTQLQGALHAERETARDLEEQLTQVQDDLDEAKIDKAQAEADVDKCRKEIEDLEGAIIRTQTDLTVVRAELDGAYGTRAQRAADVTSNPAVQKELDALNDKNSLLQKEMEDLRTKGTNNTELETKIHTLEKELKDTIEDYAQLTKAGVEFEKDREQLEASVDKFRERCESLENKLSEERVKGLGVKSPGVNGPGSPGGSTSTMVLKNEFKKMMRDTRAENLKALRAEQDERRKLEALVRSLKADQQPQLSSRIVATANVTKTNGSA